MQRGPPGPSCALRLELGPVHAVQESQTFDGPVVQVGGVVLKGVKAPDVHLGQVLCGLALNDPLGQGLTGTCRRGDSARVQACRHEEIPQFGRLSQDVVVVRREALRPHQEPDDLDIFHGRDSLYGLLQKDHVGVPVALQHAIREVVRDAVHTPRLSHGLESPHEQPPLVFDVPPEVNVPVRVAQRRHVGRHAIHGFGDKVGVIGCV